MKIKDYLARSITWKATDDAEFPYASTMEGKSIRIRLNDFPAEHLYSLIVDTAEFNFDDWPASWVKAAAKRISKTTTVSRDRLAKVI